MSDVGKANRTELLHVRMKPELRRAIDDEARSLKMAPSTFVRSLLVEHFTTKK